VRHCYTSSLSAQDDASFGLGAKHLKQEEVRRADVEDLGALKTSTLVQVTPGYLDLNYKLIDAPPHSLKYSNPNSKVKTLK
jgi:hypothetical protein